MQKKVGNENIETNKQTAGLTLGLGVWRRPMAG